MQPQMRKGEDRHRFIRGYLTLRGITLSEIAKEAGVSRQMVSAVSKGTKRSEKVEQVLIKYGIPQSLLSNA